jgi:hypothetical protein
MTVIKMKQAKGVVSVLLALFANFAIASGDYRCTIDRVDSANPDSAYKSWAAQVIGKEFTVDRNSGVMVGALKNQFVTQPVVIDRGSAENSFKVVTTLRTNQVNNNRGSNIHVLVVEEYASAPKKPFVYLWNADVFIGTCVDF